MSNHRNVTEIGTAGNLHFEGFIKDIFMIQ